MIKLDDKIIIILIVFIADLSPFGEKAIIGIPQ